MDVSLPYSSFSTALLPPTQRFESWRETLSVVYEPTIPNTADMSKFTAGVEGYLFGPVSQMNVHFSAQHFSRTGRHIDRDGVDNYMIQIFSRGSCVARTSRGDVHMRPGDICVFDNTQPLDSTDEDCQLLALFVPRSLLAPHLRRADNHHLNVVRAHEPLAILLRQHLRSLHESAPNLTLDQANLLVAPTVSLLAAALNGAPDSAEGSGQAVHMALTTTIRRFVDENLPNPALNADMICEKFGLSRSRLYKLFEATDGVATYIRNRRLKAALAILSDPGQFHRKIIDIALTVGFASEVSFIRAFRRRYDYTPSEARYDPSAAYRTNPGNALNEYGDTEWQKWMRSL